MPKVINLRNKTRPIQLPIGTRSVNKVKQTIMVPPNGSVDLSDDDAKALIDLDRQLNLAPEMRTRGPEVWGWALEGEALSAAVQSGEPSASEQLTQPSSPDSNGDETVEAPAPQDSEEASEPEQGEDDQDEPAQAGEGGAAPRRKKKRWGRRSKTKLKKKVRR